MQGRLAGPGRRGHRGGQRHRAGHRAAVRRRGGPGGLRGHRRRRPGERPPTRWAASSSPATWPTRRRSGTSSTGWRERHGRVDIAFNNAGISPPDDDSILEHRAGRLGAGAAGQHHQRLPVLQVRHPAHAPAGQGLDHQHRVVRGADGRGHLADRVHREQGRGAGDDPGAGRAVRPGGHPGQRALPRPGRHPAAAGAVRQGPGAGRPAAGARADGPVRPSRRRSPPRWRSWPATTRRS